MGSYSPASNQEFYVNTPRSIFFEDFQGSTTLPDALWGSGTLASVSGLPALDVNDTSTTTFASSTSQFIAVNPSTSLTVSGWARTPEDTAHQGNVSIFVYEFTSTSDTNASYTHTINFNNSAIWSFNKLSFTTAGTTHYLKLRFYPCAGNVASTGEGQLAEAKVEQSTQGVFFEDFRSSGTLPDALWDSGTLASVDGLSVLAVDDASTTTFTSSTSKLIPVNPANRYVVSGWARTPDGASHQGNVSIFVYELTSAIATSASFTHILSFSNSSVWNFNYLDFTADSTTRYIKLRFYPCAGFISSTGTGQLAEVKVTQPPTGLVNASGAPLAGISDIVDLAEEMPSTNFWNLVSAPSSYTASSVNLWTDAELRDAFIGQIPISSVDAASANHALLNAPVAGYLGAPLNTSSLRVAALDIPATQPASPAPPFHPILDTYDGYSAKYYPRRMGDYAADFRQAYLLTGASNDLSDRAQMLDYLLYSQYLSVDPTAPGDNQFLHDFYRGNYTPAGTGSSLPNDYATLVTSSPHLAAQWIGGFDYLFDWSWTDAYHYTWQPHETDAHVCALMSTELVRGYEGTPASACNHLAYLAAAAGFVYNQVPRYGFHTGLWNGNRYYWTEYNPSSARNPNLDATDNVQALVAETVAMVGYYENDPKLLSYAQGLLWYIAREIDSDGWFYYEGAENPINSRKAMSHDEWVIYPAFRALAYLRRAGVNVSGLSPYFRKILDDYANTSPINGTGSIWGGLQYRNHVLGWRTYNDVPAAGHSVVVTDYIQLTANSDLHAFTISEAICNSSSTTSTAEVAELMAPSDPSSAWQATLSPGSPFSTPFNPAHPYLLSGFQNNANNANAGRVFRVRFTWTPTADDISKASEAFSMSTDSGQDYVPAIKVYTNTNPDTGNLLVNGGDSAHEGNFFTLALAPVFPQ